LYIIHVTYSVLLHCHCAMLYKRHRARTCLLLFCPRRAFTATWFRALPAPLSAACLPAYLHCRYTGDRTFAFSRTCLHLPLFWFLHAVEETLTHLHLLPLCYLLFLPACCRIHAAAVLRWTYTSCRMRYMVAACSFCYTWPPRLPLRATLPFYYLLFHLLYHYLSFARFGFYHYLVTGSAARCAHIPRSRILPPATGCTVRCLTAAGCAHAAHWFAPLLSRTRLHTCAKKPRVPLPLRRYTCSLRTYTHHAPHTRCLPPTPLHTGLLHAHPHHRMQLNSRAFIQRCHLCGCEKDALHCLDAHRLRTHHPFAPLLAPALPSFIPYLSLCLYCLVPSRSPFCTAANCHATGCCRAGGVCHCTAWPATFVRSYFPTAPLPAPATPLPAGCHSHCLPASLPASPCLYFSACLPVASRWGSVGLPCCAPPVCARILFTFTALPHRLHLSASPSPRTLHTSRHCALRCCTYTRAARAHHAHLLFAAFWDLTSHALLPYGRLTFAGRLAAHPRYITRYKTLPARMPRAGCLHTAGALWVLTSRLSLPPRMRLRRAHTFHMLRTSPPRLYRQFGLTVSRCVLRCRTPALSTLCRLRMRTVVWDCARRLIPHLTGAHRICIPHYKRLVLALRWFVHAAALPW